LGGRRATALVSAVDPSPSFAAAVRERLPGVDVRGAGAEELPFADGSFGAVLAQLVVHFMADPVAGLREMGRVAGRDGTVAACVWDYGGGRSPLSLFWRAARDLDPAVPDESGRAGVREGDLAELFARAGLRSVRNAALIVEARYASFDDWWEPLTLGVGPAGAHVAGLSADDRAALREHCRGLLPDGPIEVPAAAWAAVSPP
jgi:SAM-dependent methyltransferase